MRAAIGFGLLLGGGLIAAACTTVLGDDFRIGDGPSGGSGANGGSGGATTSSGTQAGSAGGGFGGAGGAGGAGNGGSGGSGGATTSSASGGGGGSGGAGTGGGGACSADLADCDGNGSCETDLTTAADCGACGARCVTGICDRRSCTGITQLAGAPSGGGFLSLYGGYVYWTAAGSGGMVQRVPLAGGRATRLATMQEGANGIVANAAGLFWTCNSANTVVRAQLDGSAQETLAETDYTPLYMAGDENEIFWAQRENANVVGGPASTIGRLDVDTNDADQGFLSAPLSPHGIALDAQYLYWVDRATAGGNVNRVDRRTGISTPPLATGQMNPYGIAVDDQNLYWTNNGGLGVARMPKNGSSAPVSLATGDNLRDIAIDATHIYWTDQGNGRVRKVPKAGGPVRDIATSVASPSGIAVDATHVYWLTESGSGTLYKAPK